MHAMHIAITTLYDKPPCDSEWSVEDAAAYKSNRHDPKQSAIFTVRTERSATKEPNRA